MQKPYLSLIIPAYNEEDRIVKSLDYAHSYLIEQPYTYEIIVVDDGSNDDTVAVARRIDYVKVISQPQNMGKGAAVRRGMLEAIGEVRVFSDADFSTPIYELEKIIEKLKSGADICIGSRAVDSTMIKKHQPFYREFMGKSFNRIVQKFLFKGIKDTQCGFKGFTSATAERIFSICKIDGFSFDVEVLYLASKYGYNVAQVAVEWYNDNRSKVNPITDSTKMFLELFRIKKLHSSD